MPSDSFIRLTSFTVASGPAASSAVVVSLFRLPRRPPAAFISSAARGWALSRRAPSTAPRPPRIRQWPDLTRLSGERAPRIERRVAPGRPAVRSHLDARYGARAPRPAADLRGSAHELRAISRRHDDGLHVEVAHGLADHPAVHGVPAVVEPRGEETLGAVIGNVDAREPLDGVRAEEAGHEGP